MKRKILVTCLTVYIGLLNELVQFGQYFDFKKRRDHRKKFHMSVASVSR